MKYSIYGAIAVIMFFFSCKQSDSSTTTGQNVQVLPVNQQYILNNQVGVKDSLVQLQRQAALSILEHRIKNSNHGMTNVLEKDVWHVEAFLSGDVVTFGIDLKGFWIDFQDNNKYAYGSFDATLGTGRYVYSTENGNQLLLLDDDRRIKPQEFDVMYNNDSVALVGQATYHDNNMQVKMNRKADYPAVPTKTEWDGNEH